MDGNSTFFGSVGNAQSGRGVFGPGLSELGPVLDRFGPGAKYSRCGTVTVQIMIPVGWV